EQDVTPLTIDLGKEYRLDQSVAIVKSGELHRLVLGGMYRLGRGEHAGSQDVPAQVPMQLGAGAEPETLQAVGVELHRVGIGNESQRGVFFPATTFGGILLEHRN